METKLNDKIAANLARLRGATVAELAAELEADHSLERQKDDDRLRASIRAAAGTEEEDDGTAN